MHDTVAITEASRAGSAAPQEKIVRQGIDALLEALYGPGHGLDDFLSWLGLDEREVALLKRECLEAYTEHFLLSVGTILKDRQIFQTLLLRYGLIQGKKFTLDQTAALLGLSSEQVSKLQARGLHRLRWLRNQLEHQALVAALDLLDSCGHAPRWLTNVLSLIKLPSPSLDIVETVKNCVAGRQAGPDDIPVDAIGLTSRVFNALCRRGIESVGDLLAILSRGDDELLAIHGMGEKGIAEIKSALQRAGFWEEQGGRPQERPLTEAEEELYTALQIWRGIRAAQKRVPPYRVAYDHCLRQMARKRPVTLKELAQIRGFDNRQVRQYGSNILRVIHTFGA